MPDLIPAHGCYRDLKSYQMSEIIYDAAVTFCDRFISRRSRTHDQMVQAARSGKQNIAEGSMASGAYKKTELKLMASPGPASKSSCSTTRTIFGKTVCASGVKATRNRCQHDYLHRPPSRLPARPSA